MIQFENDPLFRFFLGWLYPPKPAFLKFTPTPRIRAMAFTIQVGGVRFCHFAPQTGVRKFCSERSNARKFLKSAAARAFVTSGCSEMQTR